MCGWREVEVCDAIELAWDENLDVQAWWEVSQKSSKQRVHSLSEFRTGQFLCRGIMQAVRCQTDCWESWHQEAKEHCVCTNVVIVSKGNGLLPGAIGEEGEADQFPLAVHEILLKRQACRPCRCAGNMHGCIGKAIDWLGSRWHKNLPQHVEEVLATERQ